MYFPTTKRLGIIALRTTATLCQRLDYHQLPDFRYCEQSTCFATLQDEQYAKGPDPKRCCCKDERGPDGLKFLVLV